MNAETHTSKIQRVTFTQAEMGSMADVVFALPRAKNAREIDKLEKMLKSFLISMATLQQRFTLPKRFFLISVAQIYCFDTSEYTFVFYCEEGYKDAPKD